jgi:hypothetical protein
MRSFLAALMLCIPLCASAFDGKLEEGIAPTYSNGDGTNGR